MDPFEAKEGGVSESGSAVILFCLAFRFQLAQFHFWPSVSGVRWHDVSFCQRHFSHATCDKSAAHLRQHHACMRCAGFSVGIEGKVTVSHGRPRRAVEFSSNQQHRDDQTDKCRKGLK